MRLRGSVFSATLVLVLAMAACGGSSKSGTSKTSTPGVSGVHSAYVANSADGTISEYGIDDSGVMTELTGSPFTVSGGSPQQLAMTPDGKFLYASDSTKNTIFAMSIDANSGILTSIGTTTSGAQPSWMAMAPSGKFLYVANEGANNFSVYAVGSDGKLTEASFSPVAVNGPVQTVTVSPKGTYLFAAVPSTGVIYEYALDANTGAATVQAGTPMTVGSTPGYVVVSPDETFAIVLDNNSILNRLNIGTGGALTLAPNSPFVAGSEPIFGIIDPSNTWIYILNHNSNNVSILTYTSGSPRSIGQAATGIQPAGMAISGNYMYVTDSADNTVHEYKVDLTSSTSTAATGLVSSISPLYVKSGKTPMGIAVR